MCFPHYDINMDEDIKKVFPKFMERSMDIVTYPMSAPKEVYEVGKCLQTLLEKIAEQLKDGAQLEDIVIILTSVFPDLSKAVAGIQELPEDFVLDPIESSLALINPIALGAKAFLKK